jgi:CRISPR-associated exonuclease Cas4
MRLGLSEGVGISNNYKGRVVRSNEKRTYEEDELLPLSGVEHLLYCARQAALIHIEGAWADNVFTAEGRVQHERAHEPARESRRDVRVARGLRLRSLELGLSGMTDVVEFWRSSGQEDEESSFYVPLAGIDGLWKPFPVEYKRGALRSELGYKVQLCAQAMCLEEMLGCTIAEGAIFFRQTSRRLAVLFEPSLRQKTVRAAASYHELISSGRTPSATYSSKCPRCSLIELCLPRPTRRRSATKYLSDALATTGNGEECESS